MRRLLITALTLTSLCATAEEPWDTATRNADAARSAFLGCWRFSQGWLQCADPATGLIPRNLKDSPYWNAKDSAADNYPFLVLSTWFTDRAALDGPVRAMLETEQRLCNRIDRLPDDFDFRTQAFRAKEAKLPDLIFGASEYIKDGLLPLTEWLGQSPWSDRMVGLMDDIWKHAEVETEVGKVPGDSHEVAGDLMQGLSRLYWFTGNERYRDQAYMLAEYYFTHHSPVEVDKLQLDDHGCEVLGGLTEVYFLAAHKDPERHKRWQPAMHKILDRILEVGRDENGLLYNRINPLTGEILSDDRTDNWGYNYNAFVAVDQLDNVPRYREAVVHVLTNLPKNKDYPWEGRSSDGYADSLEGCLNLMNRIPSREAAGWADYTANLMLAKQRDTGIIEGWHGDGNFGRTALMYALWKTQGAYLQPWRADLRLGAARAEDGTVYFVVTSDWPWSGSLRFDIPRHAENLKMPADCPRLNQFPEWFTVPAEGTYTTNDGEVTATALREGLPLAVAPDKPYRLTLTKAQ
jgi:hypothetical protein